MIGNIDEFHSPEKTQGNITQFFNNQPTKGAFSWRDAPTGNAPGLPQQFVNNLYKDGINENPNPYRPGFRGDNLPEEYGEYAYLSVTAVGDEFYKYINLNDFEKINKIY